MRRLLISAVLVIAFPFHAVDVHVRVDPSAPHINPGSENLTTFPTIQNALDHHPFATHGGRVYIEIVPGTYRERVIVTQNHPNIILVGLGKSPEDVVITNSLNAKTAGGTFFLKPSRSTARASRPTTSPSKSPSKTLRTTPDRPPP